MKRYLFINEDGEPFVSETAPTEHDTAAVRAGILQVIDVESMTELSPEGTEWVPIKKGRIIEMGKKGSEDYGRFHQIES